MPYCDDEERQRLRLIAATDQARAAARDSWRSYAASCVLLWSALFAVVVLMLAGGEYLYAGVAAGFLGYDVVATGRAVRQFRRSLGRWPWRSGG